ncbi:MAG: FHA domain-containing protein [Planctomycetaceae bacterium]
MAQKRAKPTVFSGVANTQRPTMAEPTPDATSDPAQPFRPTLRPPMAIIELLDDCSDRGESHRVRTDAVTIGRSNADIIVPHDSQVSGLHVQISRRFERGAYQWFLKDLSSTNGTFVKIQKATLVPGVPFMIGSFRYVFRPVGAAEPSSVSDDQSVGTQGWQAINPEELTRLSAAIVRLNHDGSESAFPLLSEDLMIGTDPSCGLNIADDPAVSAVHARIREIEAGRVLEDQKSRNGIWIGISERRIGKSVAFQIGEQRIRFKVI